MLDSLALGLIGGVILAAIAGIHKLICIVFGFNRDSDDDE